MSSDPFALPSALRSLERFLENLVAELRARRAPLEDALGNLLFVWDTGFGPHEVAARLAAVGAAVRDAGLRGEVHRVYGVRAANRESEIGMTTAFGLLDAAAGHDDVAGLLARLHGEHHDLVPGVRAGLARAANDLLVAWDHHHAADYPTQFRAEVQRLDLGLHLVERWQTDHKPVTPKLSAAAALVLDVLLDGGRFAVGWFGGVPDLEVYDEYTDPLNDTITDEVSVTIVDTKPNSTTTDESKTAPKPGRKRKIPKLEADALINDYLLRHKSDPDAVRVAKIVAATGVSSGAVSGNPMWQAFYQECKKRRGGTIRTVPNGQQAIVYMGDVKAEDPSEIAARNESSARSATALDRDTELAALIREQELDDDCRPTRRERSQRS